MQQTPLARTARLITACAIVLAQIAAVLPTRLTFANHTPTPTSAALAGSVQSQLGCPGEWQPECPNTELIYDATDTVWQNTFAIPAGPWEYKVALNDNWTESYGQNAGAANIVLNQATAGNVKFYYDHNTHWVADTVNKVIAVAPGSFQDELGCPGEWQPDCLRSWLQDPDNDGIYTFSTTAIPAGSYEAKVALNESWTVNYGAGGVQDGPNIAFTVANSSDPVTFSYDAASHVLTITSDSGGVDPALIALVQAPARHPIQNDVFYFVMPDRFANGDSANDGGGLSGSRSVTGLDPTDKGYYHGGDVAGLRSKLNYLKEMGITAVWMTPIFKNKPVQGVGAAESAGYHGYWITDFTQIDSHLGTNDELKSLISEANALGIKVFFDIITNHTADVINYVGGQTSYRNKTDYPYRDSTGTPFDDRDFVGGDAFPALDANTSFPYQPALPAGEATVKVPAWLNDPLYYHNRGDSSFSGENSIYGDFFGLDDLFTEQPTVRDGLIDIYKSWITNFGIDGFRVDTVKHVNKEFWQKFAVELQQHAAAQGKPNFYIFGEVFSGNEQLLSYYTAALNKNNLDLPAVLDFGFQSAVRNFASAGGATDNLKAFFEKDDWFIDNDSNAAMLPTFIGNHDMGRIGYFLNTDNPGAPDAELLARSQLAHALLYLARGVPVIYYGDEQGFTGTGGDKDARQDMMPSLVAEYNANDLIGTDKTTADDNFDPTHPLYQTLQTLSQLYQAHPTLRTGAQIHRYSSNAPGIYAFSRIDRAAQVEYVVALNNSASSQSATFAVYHADTAYDEISGGTASATSDANKQLTVTVPAFGWLVLKQGVGVSAPASAAPAISFANLTDNQEVTLTAPEVDGNQLPGRMEVAVNVAGSQYGEVTFAVRPTGTTSYTVIGVDDNPPYRIFYDASGLPTGTTLDFAAVLSDHAANYSAATVSGIKPVVAGGGGGGTASYQYAVLHYQRSDNDYGDETTGNFNDFWGLHLWGEAIDPSEGTQWQTPKPFLGEDGYGRFAWIKLQDASQDVNFIVHRGDVKDGTDADRKFNPATDSPEIWLKQGDPNFYTSQAAAQGFVTIHYHRPDGNYTGWGLHLWGDAIADGIGTDWANPRPQDGVDSFGAYWNVPIKDATKPVNFIIHQGDNKDPGPDQSMNPSETPSVWINSASETIHAQECSATGQAILHYRRDADDYGDYTSSNYNDFWGLHSWADAPDPGWTTPHKPAATDKFGVAFKLNLVGNSGEMGYIFHRGDSKDPGPDQFLNFAQWGCEVWQLQGADPEAPYLLPIRKGVIPAGDLSKAQAHWLDQNTLAWDIEPVANASYRLYYAPSGGLVLANNVISGGTALELVYDPAGLSAALKAKFPHLANFAAFRVKSTDLAQIPAILKGQMALAVTDASGTALNATALQLPGVLDALYTYTGTLGLSWNGDVPTLRLWAPTAKTVKLHLFASSTAPTATQVIDLAAGDKGTWGTVGDASWNGQYYLYEVEVYVHSTGKVEHNIVTDPYSVGLATNSKRSLIVNLADPATQPVDWGARPLLPDLPPEAFTIYELHIRDFSSNDPTVPAADRGGYLAFTHLDAKGMKHLKALADAGLTHVHLLPTFDLASINEDKSQQLTPTIPTTVTADSEIPQAAVKAVADQDGFNWGYDPYHYGVPEGSYATDPDGATRTKEFRAMVQALNSIGLRVVMDVVYNHTSASGQAEKSVLDKIVPGYYHRLNLDGAVEKSTCCENTATEHTMMAKLMVDTLKIWEQQYGISGFRFDLMGHHMKADMQQVQAALAPTTYLYGEGWNFGEVANNARGVNATQINLAGTGIGTFSDRLRDAVRGGGPFDNGNALISNQGTISGLYYDPNALNSGSEDERQKILLYTDQIRVGLAGNLASYPFVDRNGNLVTGAQVDYNGAPAGYTQDPQENIVYVEAHDNQTLWDISAYKHAASVTMADRVRAHNLGTDFTLLAQGVSFLHAGQDILRSKSLDRNSYNSGDWFNRLDWSYQSNNWGVGLPPEAENGSNWELMRPLLADSTLKPSSADLQFSFNHTREMLQIRRSSPLFALPTAADIQTRVRMHNTGLNQIPGLVVMSISDQISGTADLDSAYERVVILFNATDTVQTFTESALVSATLTLHPVQANSVDAVVKSATFDPATGSFTIPARTTAVFVEPASAGPAQLTIVLNAIPDAPAGQDQLDHEFRGSLGEFKLEDPGRNEYPNQQSFTVQPGSYTVHKAEPSHYRVTAINCTPGADAVVDLSQASVTVSVAANDAITCTFVSQKPVNIRTRVFADENGNQLRDSGETYQPGWSISVTNLTDSAAITKSTSRRGRATFAQLAPAAYHVCATVPNGWLNTLPGGDSCYTLTLIAGQTAEVLFGNQPNTAAAASSSRSATSGVWIHTLWADLSTDDEAADPTLVEFNGARLLFMPLVER